MEELYSLTVVTLREKLHELGLSTTGKKKELVERYYKALQPTTEEPIIQQELETVKPNTKKSTLKRKIDVETKPLKQSIQRKPGKTIGLCDRTICNPEKEGEAKDAECIAFDKDGTKASEGVTGEMMTETDKKIGTEGFNEKDRELLSKLKKRRERFGFTSDLLLELEEKEKRFKRQERFK